MALQDLLAALRAQAAARRSEELARARAEAERIRSDARLALERRRRNFVAHAGEEEEAVSRRAVARARSEAAEGVLVARERLLERVRTGLEQRLEQAEEDPQYRRMLEQELSETLARLPEGEVVVRVPDSLAALVRDATGGDPRVRVESSSAMSSGFVALGYAGRVEMDATLEARLDQVWPRLAVATLAEVTS